MNLDGTLSYRGTPLCWDDVWIQGQLISFIYFLILLL